MNNSNHRVVGTPSGAENALKIKKTGTRSKKTWDPNQISGRSARQPQPEDNVFLAPQISPLAQPRSFSEVVSGKNSKVSATNCGGADADNATLQYEIRNHGGVHVNGRQINAFREKETSACKGDCRDNSLKTTNSYCQHPRTTHKSLNESEAAFSTPDTVPANETLGSTENDATSDSKGLHEKQKQIFVVKGEPETRPFRFDEYDLRLRCRNPDCRKMTSCWDYSVVICPGCGPNSYVRYCSRQHLYDDIQYHWAYHCGRHCITGTIERTTIRPHQNPHRPYVISRGFNSVERHRQAVYRSLEPGDFFLFDDAGLLKPDFIEPTLEQWNLKRGTGPCVFQLFFPNDMTDQSRRKVFNSNIFECLGVGTPRARKSCISALHLIRESLILTGNWTEQMLDLLCLQLGGEWGGFKVPESFYNVKEANLAWHRQNMLPPTP